MKNLKIKIKRTFALALMCAVTMAGTSFNMIAASADTSEYKSWKQGDSRWGSVYLGSSGQTLSRIGCAVTSVAILMVHSGSVADNSFDPGKLCNYLSSNGGFDGYGNIRWSAATGMAGSFTYQGGGTISGSKSAKTSEIASYLDSGYYAAVSVKYGGHWVAVDRVENGTVYMIDPARGTNTDLFSVYDASGVGQIRLFKGAASSSSKPAAPAETTAAPVVTEPAVTTTAAVKTTTAATTTAAVTEEVIDETTAAAAETQPAETTVAAAPEETAAAVTTEAEAVKTVYSEGRYTSSDVINIRSNPGQQNKILGAVPANTSVFAYEIKDNWGKISYNGVEGWISLDYTSYGGVVPFFTTGLYSTVADLNLRQEADINSKSQLIVPVLTTLPVTEIKDNWGKVEYNGKTGWICMDYTSYDGEIEEKSVENDRTGKYLTFDQVNLRKGAGVSYDTICRIPGYAKLDVIEVNEDNWGKIIYKGNEGWINLDYAKLCEKSVSVGDINGDGYITINDYILLQQELTNNRKFTAAEIAISDLDGDGKITVSDLELLEKKIG